jgi:hypothetical protein
MYGLPHNVDWAPFEGATLIQVCFGEFQVQLAFQPADNEHLSISVESGYAVITASGEGVRDRGLLGGATGLLSLLGANVVGAAGTPEGALVVRFADGRSIEIYEDPDPYESYQLFIGGRHVIV